MVQSYLVQPTYVEKRKTDQGGDNILSTLRMCLPSESSERSQISNLKTQRATDIGERKVRDWLTFQGSYI